MKEIKQNIKDILSLGDLSPLEMVIQWYMIELFQEPILSNKSDNRL